MKGGYDFKVKSKKLLFEFTIRRNITVIKGDSATGKTTLLHINRASFKMLLYSIHEIYEIITDKKHADVKESYHYFKELYSNYPVLENNRMDIVVTEDSNSGCQFFSGFRRS